jgi:hypothetical protein
MCAPATLAELRVALFDELAPLYPDSSIDDGVAIMELDAPRGVPIGVHLLITGLVPGMPVQMTTASDSPFVHEGQPITDGDEAVINAIVIEQELRECAGGDRGLVIT